MTKKESPRQVSGTPVHSGLRLGLAGILMLLGALIYIPTLHYNFSFDDSAVIKENRLVAEGLAGIPELLTTSYFAGYDPDLLSNSYRPVPQIINAIQFEISGMAPKAYHLGNLIIYGLLAAMLFLALSRIFRDYPPYVPLIISFLFVIHPVHAEVVTNIKSRDEMLGLLFFMISINLLLLHIDRGKRWAWVLSWLTFFLALASKESMFTTIAIIPAVLYFFRKMDLKKSLLNALPYLAIMGIFLLIRSGVMTATEARAAEEGNPLLDAATFSEKAGTVAMMTGKYILTAILPISLAGDYSYRSFQVVSLLHPYSLGSIFAVAILAYLAARGYRSRNLYSFAIFYFFATLAFVANSLLAGYNFYADRFLFTPSLGVCIVLGLVIYGLAGKPSAGRFVPLVGKRTILAGLGILIVAALSLARIETYIPAWKDNISLFEYCVRKFPENSRMLRSLGGEYTRLAIREKDTTQQRLLSLKAVEQLKAAINIYPKQLTTYIHLGNNFILQKKYDQAEEILKLALKFDPRNRFTRKSLANVSYRQRKFKEAVYYYESIDPNYMTREEYRYLARSCEQIGDVDKARKYRALAGPE